MSTQKPAHRCLQQLIHDCQILEATKMFFTRQQINKLWYIQKMEYYSALKRNELSSSHGKTWRKQKCLLLSERSQSENAVYYMIPTI